MSMKLSHDSSIFSGTREYAKYPEKKSCPLDNHASRRLPMLNGNPGFKQGYSVNHARWRIVKRWNPLQRNTSRMRISP